MVSEMIEKTEMIADVEFLLYQLKLRDGYQNWQAIKELEMKYINLNPPVTISHSFEFPG
jgi:hypothetical protein